MKDGIIANKVKVFISSREYRMDDDETRHYERYRILRRAIKDMLEATNMAQVYVRECEGVAGSTPIVDEYLRALSEQDICVFIIDNKDDKDEHSQGVMKEYQRAKSLNKKILLIFCNEFEKAKTQIAKEEMISTGNTCLTVSTFDSILSSVYNSVINDIIKTYRDYCNPIPQDLGISLDLDNNTSIGSQVSNEPAVQVSSFKQFEEPSAKDTIHKFDTSSIPLLKSEAEKMLGIESSVKIGNDFDLLCSTLFSFVVFKIDYNETALEKFDCEIFKINKVEYHDVLKDRILAVKHYLSGDVVKCYESLKAAYLNAKTIEHFPNWLLLDILIDLRNIENHVALENGKLVIDGEWQKLISNNNEAVYYPVLDGCVASHFESIDKFLREHETENPYTTRIGNDATPLIDNCIKAFAIAVSNASLTQMLCLRERLIAGLSALCRVYSAQNQFIELLRLLSIDAKNKDIEKHLIALGFMQNISEINESEARELLNSILRITIKNNRTRAIISLFHHFGYFFSDEDYALLSNEINEIIDRFLTHESSVVNLADSITKAIQKNIQRVDVNTIVEYIINFTKFDTPHIRLTTNLLLSKSFEKISEGNKNKLVSAYIESCNRETNSERETILRGLTSLRKLYTEHADEIDSTILKKDVKYFYSDYALEINLLIKDNKPIDHISRLIGDARACNDIAKNGIWSSPAPEPLKTLSNLIKYFPDMVSDNNVLAIIEVAKETLLTDSQTYSVKIQAIELLLQICSYRGRASLNDIEDTLLNSSETMLIAHGLAPFEKDSEFLLHFNLILLQGKLGKTISSHLLSVISMTAISDYTHIKMYKALFEFSNKNNWADTDQHALFIIYQFAMQGCRHKNHEVRLLSTRILFELLRSDFAQSIPEQLSALMDDADWQLAQDIIYNISNTNVIDKHLKNYILQKAKTSSHYLVKKAVKYAENK